MDYSHDHRHSDRNNHRNPNRQEREGHRQPRSMVRGPSADMSHLFKKPAQMKTDEEQSVQMKAGEEQSVQMKKPSHEGGLPEDLQSNMQQAFGQSFSDVTIHRDSTKATEMGAQAYTQGKDVHFAPGRYNPSSTEGKELIGHELTHVVQQKQGRVQATTQAKGLPVNDDQSLEQEADEMGRKAAKGEEVGEIGATLTSGRQLAPLPEDEVDAYFNKYKDFAQKVLDDYYSSHEFTGKEKLTGAMFATAAKEIYSVKKDLSMVVPVEFALSQALLEGGFSGQERTVGNAFNVGADDKGKTKSELKITNHKEGFKAYYELMADSYLNSKKADDLLVNGKFANANNSAYATNPFYEIEIKGEIGRMHLMNSPTGLSAAVGSGKKNNPKDVEFLGGMLATLGYLSKDKVNDASAVSSAIPEFQKKEMASEGEQWFKDRMKNVTNSLDQASMKQKVKSFTDGVAGPKGITVGLLYFKTYLNGRIPGLGNIEPEEAQTAGATETTTSAVSEQASTYQYQALPENYYTVVRGDTLGTISAKFKVPVKTLEEVNKNMLHIWGAIKGFQADDIIIIPGVNVAKVIGEQKAKATNKQIPDYLKPLSEKEKEAYKKESASAGWKMKSVEKPSNIPSNKIVPEYLMPLSEKEKSLFPQQKGSDWTTAHADYWKHATPEGMARKRADALAPVAEKMKPKATVNSGDKNTGFALTGSVGATTKKGGAAKNAAQDVLKIQSLLVSLKYLPADNSEYAEVKAVCKNDPTATIDESKLADTISAIKQYQKYGATTKASVNGQDGRIDKNGYTHTSMKEMDRVYNKYKDEEFAGRIDNLLTKSQWRSQFRFGANFKDGEDAKEKQYIAYVKELTDLSDPADLHTAPEEKIKKVEKEYPQGWMNTTILKTNAIKMKEKARNTKPNGVCCWDTASLMLSFTGATAKGESSKIQTFVAESGSGTLTNQAALGVKYIDAQLKSGKGVFVGIDKGKARTINEGTTDHFIIIVGKSEENGKWFYTYFDPGRATSDGYNTVENRLYIGDDKRQVEKEKNKLSQIRVNNE